MKSTYNNTAYEKRHTKPCRFFQKDICPLSADRCDFAHVKIQILPVRYSSGQLKPPRAGQCDHRENRHLTVPIETGVSKATTLRADPGTECRSLGDLTSSAPRAHVPSQTLRRSTHTPSPAAKVLVPHGPKLYPREHVLPPPVPGQLPVANTACSASVPSEGLVRVIFRGGDSSPTSDVPSLSDGDSGPPSAACEAPELTERWPGSPSAPSPTVYYNPSPGLFSPGVPFTHPAYGPWTSPKQATHSESRRHGMSMRKLKALKTKQCKFFKKDGRCPQGSLCTFIHDPSTIQAPQVEQEPPSDSSSYSSQASSETCPGIDEDRERNIFPITWRVIGGGVMMGGRREVCTRLKDGSCPGGDDCPYVHPWEEDIQSPIEATSSHTSTPRASCFLPQVAGDISPKQLSPPGLELIPDIAPIVPRGCGPPPILGTREELPPRPFSTPPRIHSRTDAAAATRTRCP